MQMTGSEKEAEVGEREHKGAEKAGEDRRISKSSFA